MQTTLTRIFILLESNCPKIQTKFLGMLGNSKGFFPLKIGWSPKKKVFAEIESEFSAKIRNSRVFSAQNQVVSKKKERSSPKLSPIFWPKSGIQTFERGLFSYGGAIFNFSQKIGLKTTKNVRFCILHKPMGGGSSPPAPPWLRY